jgi:hypothetical protein
MEDILMIVKQIENGNRWALISTFIRRRTENQVKNRFKHILKKYAENKYGKEFFRKYSSESLKKTTLENIGTKDKIVEELLNYTITEMKNSSNTSQAYHNPMNINSQMAMNGNSNDYSLYQSSSAFRKVGLNHSKYTRNAGGLQSMHSQPTYMSNSFDYIQMNMKNLNDESINLNKSMRMIDETGTNSTNHEQNKEFSIFPSKRSKDVKLVNSSRKNNILMKKSDGYGKLGRDNLHKVTVP